MKQPTQYWSRILLRNRSSPPTTDCDKIRPLQTLEALLILLSAKPYIFLLPGACLLNSFVCHTAVLTEVYPEFTRHLGLFRFKQLALYFNDNFCCVPCLPFATWKVAICLLIASDEGNQREEMDRCGTSQKHIQEETDCQTNMTADQERALTYVVPKRSWARK